MATKAAWHELGIYNPYAHAWATALAAAVEWATARYGPITANPVAIPGFGTDRFPAAVADWAKEYAR